MKHVGKSDEWLRDEDGLIRVKYGVKRVLWLRRLNRYEVIEIWWLSGIKNSVSEIDNLIFISFRNFKTIRRLENRSAMLGLRSLDKKQHSGCVGDIFIWYFGIVKLGCTIEVACFGGVKIKVGTDTAKSTNVTIAGFRQCRDLIREIKMFIKYEAKVASSLRSVSWSRRVANFWPVLL